MLYSSFHKAKHQVGWFVAFHHPKDRNWELRGFWASILLLKPSMRSYPSRLIQDTEVIPKQEGVAHQNDHSHQEQISGETLKKETNQTSQEETWLPKWDLNHWPVSERVWDPHGTQLCWLSDCGRSCDSRDSYQMGFEYVQCVNWRCYCDCEECHPPGTIPGLQPAEKGVNPDGTSVGGGPHAAVE